MPEFTVSPPSAVRRCPDCTGNHSVSINTTTDGSTTVRYYSLVLGCNESKGTYCQTCDGSGYVTDIPIERHVFIVTSQGKPWNSDWWKYCDVCGGKKDDPRHTTDSALVQQALRKALEDEEVK